MKFKLGLLLFGWLFMAGLARGQQFILQYAIPLGNIVQGQTNQQGGGWQLIPQNDWVAGSQAQIAFTFPLPTQLNTALACTTADHLSFWCDVHGMVFTHGVGILGNELVDATNAAANTNYTISVDGFYIEGFSVNGTVPFRMSLSTVQAAVVPPPPTPNIIGGAAYITNWPGYSAGVFVRCTDVSSCNLTYVLTGIEGQKQYFTDILAPGYAKTFDLGTLQRHFIGSLSVQSPQTGVVRVFLCGSGFTNCQEVN